MSTHASGCSGRTSARRSHVLDQFGGRARAQHEFDLRMRERKRRPVNTLVIAVESSDASIGDLSQTRDVKTIVFRRGCSYRGRLDTALAKHGIPVSTPLEFGSLDAIIGCAAAGVGVTMLPKGVVA